MSAATGSHRRSNSGTGKLSVLLMEKVRPPPLLYRCRPHYATHGHLSFTSLGATHHGGRWPCHCYTMILLSHAVKQTGMLRCSAVGGQPVCCRPLSSPATPICISYLHLVSQGAFHTRCAGFLPLYPWQMATGLCTALTTAHR